MKKENKELNLGKFLTVENYKLISEFIIKNGKELRDKRSRCGTGEGLYKCEILPSFLLSHHIDFIRIFNKNNEAYGYEVSLKNGKLNARIFDTSKSNYWDKVTDYKEVNEYFKQILREIENIKGK